MRSFQTVALSLAIFFVLVTDIDASDQPAIIDGTVRGSRQGEWSREPDGLQTPERRMRMWLAPLLLATRPFPGGA